MIYWPEKVIEMYIASVYFFSFALKLFHHLCIGSSGCFYNMLACKSG